MINREFFLKYRAEMVLGGIVALSGFLDLWNLWGQGFTNQYYAAAVKSMLVNPAAGLFNSLDPGGFITVDKPPVGLWVQALSASVFGFSGWSLVLPQALAAMASVVLLYAIVARPFGKPAGLLAGFALAVTPVLVAVARNQTPDAQLIFVILLALWAALRAARGSSLPYFLLSLVLVGVAFNIKMIQALIIVPAILAVYLLGSGVPARRKAAHLAAGLLVLAAVSLSWAVAVDMVPADERPYIGGSGDNTALGLILEYNGLYRLAGGGLGPRNFPGLGILAGKSMAPAGMNSGPRSLDGRELNRTDGRAATGSGSTPGGGLFPGPDGRMVNASMGQMPLGAGQGQAGAGGGMIGETGTPGILRLFLFQELAGQLSWLLPFALIGLLAWWHRPAPLSGEGIRDAGLSGEKGLTLLGLCLWLTPGLVYFSFTTGFWHTYYLATIAPPLAGLAGIGAVAMYRAYIAGGLKGWLLPVAIAATGLAEAWILIAYPAWSAILLPVTLGGSLVAALVLCILRARGCRGTGRLPKAVACIAIALLFVAPFAWALTPLGYAGKRTIPQAGPPSGGSGGAWDRPGFPSGRDSGMAALTAYLVSHNTGETYYAAALSSNAGGAALIIASGKPIMVLGGFTGSDSVISVDDLPGLIANRTVRYFLIQSSSGGGSTRVSSWVHARCTGIPSSDWSGNSSRQGNQYALYDCAGEV